MIANIEPSKALGSIKVPPSKSLAHRYIICAALAKGESHISNVDFSEDIKATIDCIKAMGARVDVEDDRVVVCGVGDSLDKESIDFYCRESGSTMRFFMGLSMYYGIPSRFFGSETLRKRPFSIYEEICKQNGITFKKEADHIFVSGKITPGKFVIPGNISSQFITGLLYILPFFDVDSTIELIKPVESKSYIDLTIQALELYGVKVTWESENVLYIEGNQAYKASDVRVEGDYSNAAFLDAFNYIGGSVKTLDLNANSLQGDRVYKSLFDNLIDANEVVDISDCPDLGPVLFAVAAANKGGHFTGTKRLKMKESDRGTVMCAELSKFGVKSLIEENDITIFAGKLNRPVEILNGHNDHRIVMSLALLLSLFGGRVNEAEAVTKSYPGFFSDIKTLGIEVDVDGMDK